MPSCQTCVRGSRLVAASIAAALPLACWPGLAHPFSTPKLILLVPAALAGATWLVCQALEEGLPTAAWFPLAAAAGVALPAILGPGADPAALGLLLLPPLAALPALTPSPRFHPLPLATAGAAIAALVALLQAVGLDPFAMAGLIPVGGATHRMAVFSTLGNPNFLSTVLVGLLPFALWICLHGQPGAVRRLGAAIGPLLVAGLAAAGSRLALTALIPAALVALALRNRRLAGALALAGLLLGAMALLLPRARPLSETLQGRMHLIRVSGRELVGVPLMGHGPGAYPALFARQETELLKTRPQTDLRFAGLQDHAHCDLMELYTELGPLGWTLWMGGVAGLLALGWMRCRRDPAAPRTAALAGAAALLACSALDFPLHRPADAGLFWLLAVCAAAPSSSTIHHPAGGTL